MTGSAREAVPEVSVIVRSKNDARTVGDTLESLFRQTVQGFEVLSVDSGSTDATPEILSRHPLRRFSLPAEGYVPGAVLNWMAREARGTFLVFLNSDATPLDRHWLERLLRPFADASVGGVYGRQLPRPGAAPWVERDHLVAFPADSARAVPFIFSLASSAIRKSAWHEVPFDERLGYSEDEDWARRARAAGWRTVYEPAAVVLHSHDYSLAELRRRFYGEGRADAGIYAGRLPARLRLPRLVLGKTFAEGLRDTLFCLRRGRPGAVPAALLRRFVQNFYRWRGIRSGRALLVRGMEPGEESG